MLGSEWGFVASIWHFTSSSEQHSTYLQKLNKFTSLQADLIA